MAIGLIGALPAIAVAAVPNPATDPTPLVAALLLFGPAALLILWTFRDREGQAARELTMWLNSLSRAAVRDSVAVPVDELPETPPPDELDRVGFRSLALEYREVLEPMVANSRALFVRIGIYRWWYPVLVVAVTVIALLAFAAFLAVAP